MWFCYKALRKRQRKCSLNGQTLYFVVYKYQTDPKKHYLCCLGCVCSCSHLITHSYTQLKLDGSTIKMSKQIFFLEKIFMFPHKTLLSTVLKHFVNVVIVVCIICWHFDIFINEKSYKSTKIAKIISLFIVNTISVIKAIILHFLCHIRLVTW